MSSERPSLSSEEAAAVAARHWGIVGELSGLPSYVGQNFRIASPGGPAFILKLAPNGTPEDQLDLENQAMLFVEDRVDFETPVPMPTDAGQRIVEVRVGSESLRARLFHEIPGVPLAASEVRSPELRLAIGQLLGELDGALQAFEHPAVRRDLAWDPVHAGRHREHLDSLPAMARERRALLEDIFLELDARLPDLAHLPRSVIHCDANDHNILLRPDEPSRISGLLDFGDVVLTATISELAVACAYLALGEEDPLQAAADVARGYSRVRPLGRLEIEVLHTLLRARLAVSAVTSARQALREPENEYLFVSEAAVWQLIEGLAAVTPARALEVLAAGCGATVKPAAALDRETILELRRRHLGPSLSLSYSTPLHIVRGRDRYLFDAEDWAYLDLVNNVCHVGHCHPRVVAALTRQAGRLNTNTRYLHEHIVEYARRLTATLPDALSVCFFVNSGSEANELALRLAAAATRRRGVLVLEGGYHGNTNATVDVSSYKFDGPGGSGAPEHVFVAPMPDRYRGRYRGSDEEVTGPYVEAAGLLLERAEDTSFPVGVFLAESLLSCGGQIELPVGYLEKVYALVRQAGGICVADEVQIGFGRVGSHFWGFETHGVVPDVVTMGKPIGNGHPLAAVVTTREIAAAFANGMEYFNTYGGNPVACAVGLAVLDVLEEQALQGNARDVGTHFLHGLRALAGRYPRVGDARGRGLFLGIELVEDPRTREPAPALAAAIVETMRARRILLSTDGPAHNVIKIKPPMTLTKADADFVLRSLDDVLSAEEGAPE